MKLIIKIGFLVILNTCSINALSEVSNPNLLKIDNETFKDKSKVLNNPASSLTKEDICRDDYFRKKYPKECAPVKSVKKSVKKNPPVIKKATIKKVKKRKKKKVYDIKKKSKKNKQPVDDLAEFEKMDIDDVKFDDIENQSKVYQPVYSFGRWLLKEVAYSKKLNRVVDDSYHEDYSSIGYKSLKHTYPLFDQSRMLGKSSLVPININSAIFVEDKQILLRAEVARNVYGKIGGKILIPAGSLATGIVKPVRSIGLVRINIIWQSIDTPRGMRIDLGNSITVNASGVVGIGGFIDNRTFERYGMPLLFNLLNNAIATKVLSIDTENQAALTAVAKTAGDITTAIIKDHINIKPTMRVNVGKQANIVLSNDIFFLPPIIKSYADIVN